MAEVTREEVTTFGGRRFGEKLILIRTGDGPRRSFVNTPSPPSTTRDARSSPKVRLRYPGGGIVDGPICPEVPKDSSKRLESRFSDPDVSETRDPDEGALHTGLSPGSLEDVPRSRGPRYDQ